jgi:hypothetical protein
MVKNTYVEPTIASPHVEGVPTGRRLPYGMDASAITVVKTNENKNAWFIPGHLRMSIASMDSFLFSGAETEVSLHVA